VAAAPALLTIVRAWEAVPDVRTLVHDLQEAGRPLLKPLLDRLGAAVATIEAVLPDLEARSQNRAISHELGAGVGRLRLLTDALSVLDGELVAAGAEAIGAARAGVAQGRFSPARQGLLARLATEDPELACDAEAVLSLGPA
jgi:hypothetical protein